MKTAILLFSIVTGSFALGAQALSNTKRDLDKNNVKARINTNNDKFWDINGTGMPFYEVPKGKGRHSAYANSIWIGGLDHGNQLHLVANTYKQDGWDTWPGPLDTANIANFSSTATAVYNRLWKIDCNDINAFATAFNNGSITANTYTAPADLLAYPGKGISNFQKTMAPFVDANQNGVYDPLTGGDYPIIKGHQQILSIFNDNFGTHTESSAPSMGIEIHERSYSYSEPLIHDSMQAINYTTFHLYTIYNRSSTNYHDVYVSDWNDLDVGYFKNDFIGSDTLNGFAYCYNAGTYDTTTSGYFGYGHHPPVSSHALLPTDCSNDGIDNNQNNIIDEPGETFKMDRVTYYNSNLNIYPPPTKNPATANDFYNYMKGNWKDNTPFTFGGTAYGNGTPTKYVYPGNPATNSGWTEVSAGNPPGDRRFILSSGPFNFPAKSKIEWGFAIVFSQDTLNQVNTISQFQSRVQRDVKNVKYYESQHLQPQCKPAIVSTVGMNETHLILNAMFYPNPVKAKLTVDLNENVKSAVITITDLLGKTLMIGSIDRGYRTQLNLEDLNAGIYILEVRSDNRSRSYKFVKE